MDDTDPTSRPDPAIPEPPDGDPSEGLTADGAPHDGDAPDGAAHDGDAAPGPSGRRFSRRQVLTMAGATGLIGTGIVVSWLGDDGPPTRGAASRRMTTSEVPTTTTTAPPATEPAPPATEAALWSDPATWGGRVPGPGEVAVVNRPVLLDVDASVAGVRIEAGAELLFDPAASRTLTSTGNVIVAGALRARPQGHEVAHRLVFDGIDEGRIVGGHTMEPLDTDVGLWVVGDGALDLQGTRKRAWTNLTRAASAGETTLDVADAAGWRPGDEVVVSATVPPSEEEWPVRHDRRTVAAVDGSTVTLDGPLEFDHPAVTVRPGRTFYAEVLNLTRNVQIEGTEGGRAHVILLSINAPQQLAWVGLRHLGPQELHPEREGLQGTLGRYSLHFHMNYERSHGSLVEGVVAYDGGNHAFVPHLSHGITFRDCIAHDQSDTAYWWDQATEGAEEQHGGIEVEGETRIPTDDLTYERCVASFIKPSEGSTYTLAGFLLAPGKGQVARGCVATGILGDDQGTPGYLWTEDSIELEDTWIFEDNLSHNNAGSSVYYWINNAPPSLVDRFTAYHDAFGIRAGAYTNLVSYRDCTVYGCEDVGLVIEAVPGLDDARPDATVTYENLYVDQAGRTDYAVAIGGHVVEAQQVTRMVGCQFKGGTAAQVVIEGSEYGQLYAFTDCSFDGNALWLEDGMTGPVDITIDDAVHGAVRVVPAGDGGQPKPDWNAAVTSP